VDSITTTQLLASHKLVLLSKRVNANAEAVANTVTSLVVVDLLEVHLLISLHQEEHNCVLLSKRENVNVEIIADSVMVMLVLVVAASQLVSVLHSKRENANEVMIANIVTILMEEDSLVEEEEEDLLLEVYALPSRRETAKEVLPADSLMRLLLLMENGLQDLLEQPQMEETGTMVPQDIKLNSRLRCY